MKENELTIEIPEGKEIDWDESKRQNKIVFKKKDTKPRSWEEYCEQHNTTVTNRYFIDNGAEVRVSGWHPDIPSDMLKNTLPSKELAEAFRAMMQLMSLRQDWIHKWSLERGMTDDWEPDWHDMGSYKYCILGKYNSDFDIFAIDDLRCPLSFPTEEMANDFVNCFKDLLEIAKPLI